MDAHQRRELIAQYEAGYDAIVQALDGMTDAEWDAHEAPGEWSPREVVHHLADSEMTSAIRLRRLLVEENPLIQGYDEAEFARRLHYDRPVEASMRAFEAARRSTAALFPFLTDADWRRAGVHSDTGPYTMADWLTIYAEHAFLHADQIRRARDGEGKRRMTANDWQTLPTDLPVPQDDGAAAHLRGMRLPSMPLVGTDGRIVDFAALPGTVVIYAYPRTGEPDKPLPDGWDLIPGARGCTPQSCAFRDHHAELHARGAEVFGLSTQSTAYQQEAATRLHLPFALLSDADLHFARALRLPTFTTAGMTLLKRLTMIAVNGTITHVFYPVFPPDRNADDVLAWLQAERTVQSSSIEVMQ